MRKLMQVPLDLINFLQLPLQNAQLLLSLAQFHMYVAHAALRLLLRSVKSIYLLLLSLEGNLGLFNELQAQLEALRTGLRILPFPPTRGLLSAQMAAVNALALHGCNHMYAHEPVFLTSNHHLPGGLDFGGCKCTLA